MRKVAIFDNKDCVRYLDAARSKTDRVRVFLMLNCGIHPKNLRGLKVDKNVTRGGVIQYTRAKNARPMRHLVSEDQSKEIIHVIKRGGLNVSNRAYELMCEELSPVIPKYETPPVSPLTLRHTFILNVLREHIRDIHYVSTRAGCHLQTVIQNYLDLTQWEKIHKEEYRIPLDLTQYAL